jgi:hypothetical protein
VALALVLFAGSVSAQTVSLAELEREALSRRSSLGAARYRIVASRAVVKGAEARYLPKLVLQARGEVVPGAKLVRVADEQGDEYLVAGSRALGDSGALEPDFRYQGGLN